MRTMPSTLISNCAPDASRAIRVLACLCMVARSYRVPGIEGFVLMVYNLSSVAFYGLMAAQAFGATASCAYPWHRVDHDDHDGDTGQRQRSKPLRMLRHPA